MISLANKWVHPTKGFEIDLLTLARHLGRVVRFGGALNTYYTVLQHSLFVSHMAGLRCRDKREELATMNPMRLALWGLLHDAHEFLTGDVPTDWKTDELRAAQEGMDVKIRAALGLDPADGPGLLESDLVKQCDHEALIVEANYVSPHCLTANPGKFRNPELVEKWKDIFRLYHCPDPLLAFQRNWEIDGLYVRQFADWYTNFNLPTPS